MDSGKKIIEKKEIYKEKKIDRGTFFLGNSYPESQFFSLTLAIYN